MKPLKSLALIAARQIPSRFLSPTISLSRKMSMQTIAVCNESELLDGQMKEVDFGEGSGKVLLSRLGGDIHATSAFCTHYGAPLVKGVLTADCRVVCPWHGACFNVKTGDIEDAPAPSGIHSFKTSVSDGKIFVTADPQRTLKANTARPPKVSPESTTGNLEGSFASGKATGVVIIGGGSASFYAIESLRENGYSGFVTIISKEPHSPIDRTKLSKALTTDASKLEFRTAADLRIRFGVTLRTNTSVTSVDFNTKQVVLDGGKETIPYECLVLATGGVPRKLPIEGSSLQNVYTFRTVEDSKKVDAALKEGKRLVVIGSSFISMELVVVASKRKLASIDVIGMEEFPFELVLGKEVGAALKKFQESQGVKFHMQGKVNKIIASEADATNASAVQVTDKNGKEETLEADVVVMGVGVAPATEFLKQSTGFPADVLQRDGGIAVDDLFKVRGLEDVYAIGDIAFHPQIFSGESRRIEHWNVAGNHGRAVGKTIAGYPQPFVKVPVFWSAQGQQLRYCGMNAGYDDIFIKGDVDEMKFIAYYIKEGKVVAVASMQNDPVVSKSSELLRLGMMPSPDELRAGKDVLSIDISTVQSLNKVQGSD